MPLLLLLTPLLLLPLKLLAKPLTLPSKLLIPQPSNLHLLSARSAWSDRTGSVNA